MLLHAAQASQIRQFKEDDPLAQMSLPLIDDCRFTSGNYRQHYPLSNSDIQTMLRKYKPRKSPVFILSTKGFPLTVVNVP